VTPTADIADLAPPEGPAAIPGEFRAPERPPEGRENRQYRSV